MRIFAEATICGLSIHIDPELYVGFHLRYHKDDPDNVRSCTSSEHLEALKEIFILQAFNVVHAASDVLEHPENVADGIVFALRVNALQVSAALHWLALCSPERIQLQIYTRNMEPFDIGRGGAEELLQRMMTMDHSEHCMAFAFTSRVFTDDLLGIVQSKPLFPLSWCPSPQGPVSRSIAFPVHRSEQWL